MKQFVCESKEETMVCAREMGSLLKQSSSKNRVVCFFGDLGAGKTTFIKGLVEGYCDYSSENVNSPTFVYLNIYQAEKIVYHFDLYRLKDCEEFLSMGFDEILYMPGLILIEWSEKIESILPENCIHITINQTGEFAREITVDEFKYI